MAMQHIKTMIKDLIIILYGSTGDLTFRKLLPSLSKLKKDNKLPENTLILSIGRRDFNTNDYLNFINENNPNDDISNIKDNIEYYKMQILDEDDYFKLRDHLKLISNNNTRIIHYLAVAPNFMLDVSKNLNKANIVNKNSENQTLIFEKPFGEDFISANNINNELLNYYNESQIYRIDHYLGKSLISEIINLRFNSCLFKNLLNPQMIDKIEIKVIEEDGILNRGPFYDKTGAIKDMFQSHILQIISLLTLNKPKRLESKYITKEKIKALRRINIDEDSLVFGQYDGYLNESGVDENSLTETMFKLNLTVRNKFKNVKIKCLTGKKMEKKFTNIKYFLKDGSKLNINIYPENEITLKTKVFNKDEIFKTNLNIEEDEYSYLLLNAINKTQDKFLSTKEIEQSWKITDKILENKKELKYY